MLLNNLTTIVFSGGGVRGFSYVGACLAFFDTYKCTVGAHFKTFAGTSVGSLFALITCLDLDLQECIKTFQAVGLESIFGRDPTCLLNLYALNTGSSLETLVKNILALADLGPQSTLKDLYIKTGKKLVVSVIDLLTASIVYLDHSVTIGSDMPIVKAIMGSMALPPLFPPVLYGKGSQKILMSDGGLLENCPFQLFGPSETLIVSSTWYIDKSPIKDIASYYTRILGIVLLGSHEPQQEASKSYKNIILIDLGSMNVDDTSININEIIFVGYRAAIARLTINETNLLDNSFDPTKFIKQ